MHHTALKAKTDDPQDSDAMPATRKYDLEMPLLAAEVKYPALFRGTSPLETMRGFGSRWRLAQGLDGQAVESLFECSETVTYLDDFLSHSWRDEWWLKYMSLMVTYNLTPALILGFVTMILMYLLERNGHLPHSGHMGMLMGMFPSFLGPPTNPPFAPWCLIVSSLMVVFMLGAWPHLALATRAFTGWPRCRLVFFDRICINQNDQDQKTKGIEDLGGYLANSRRMVIFWSKIYLRRMWCVFEVATFVRAQLGTGQRLSFLPLPLVKATFLGLALFVIFLLVLSGIVIMLPAAEAGRQFEFLLFWPLIGASNVANAVFLGTFWLVDYMHDRQNLEAQLMKFDVRDAECFDALDKERVHRTINEWFNTSQATTMETFTSSHEQPSGLDHFNSFVRGLFKEQIESLIGTPASIPYNLVVLTSFPIPAFMLDLAASITQAKESMGNPGLETCVLLYAISETLMFQLLVSVCLRWYAMIAPSCNTCSTKLVACFASWAFIFSVTFILHFAATFVTFVVIRIPVSAILSSLYGVLVWRAYRA